MKREILAGCFCVAAWPALGADAVNGWSVGYSKDAFSGVVSPTATVTEGGDGFSHATLFYSCEKGMPAFAFSSGEPTLLMGKNTVQFKGEDGSVVAVDYPTATKPSSTAAIKGLFKASKDAVAFKSSASTQGLFSTVGATDVFPVIDAACATTAK